MLMRRQDVLHIGEVAAFTLVDIVFNKGSGALSCFLWGNHCESSLSGRENSMTGTSAEKC